MYFIFNHNVYKLNNNLNSYSTVYQINYDSSNFHSLSKFYYEYFNEYDEMFIIEKEQIVIIGKNNEIIKKKITFCYKDVLSISKNEDTYHILTKKQIIVLNKELEIKFYDFSWEFSYFNQYKILYKIFLNNNKIYVAYYNYELLDTGHCNTSLNLLKFDLSSNTFSNKELFKMDTQYNVLQNICVNKEYIVFCIHEYNSSTHSYISNINRLLLISYNLKTQILIEKNIKNKVSYISNISNFNNYLLIENPMFKEKTFSLFDMKSLDFIKYIHLYNKLENGYLNVFLQEKNFIILSNSVNNEISDEERNNNMRTNQQETRNKLIKPYCLHIYESSITKQDIELGALALKHIFKEKLNIDYGNHSDLKEFILEKMNCKVSLDEQDKINECIITDDNYKFIREIKL